MSEDRAIKIGGNEYIMAFPTLGRVRKLGQLLGCDVLREGIAKADYSKLFEDENALSETLKLIFGPAVDTSIMLMDMTAGDLKFVILSFFLKGQQIHASTTNGLNSFVDSFNKAILSPHLPDTPSTLPSIE